LIKGLGAIVMAAGMGTRMRSARAKVLHPVADRPMLLYAVDLAERLAERGVSVVVGYQGDQVRRILKASSEADLLVVDQIRQLGTGHAVMQARAAILQAHGQPADTYVILNGDTPLLKEATLRRLVQQHEQHRATVTILTTILRDPSGYGRVVRKRDEADQDPDGRVMRIVEDRDAQGADVHLREINVGTYVVSGSFLFDALDKLEPKNAQQEYYLTDIVALAVDRGFRVSALMADNPDEGLGINTRAQLAAAERLIRQDICARWMEAGVTIQDPATTVIGAHVQIGRDTVLHPRVTLEGRTIIGEECVLRSQVRVADSTLGRGVVVQDSCVIQESRIDDDATVGPFAHLRPGTVLHRAAKVGNFVELKKTELGSGSKANHLSYLGDARIGKGVNIGAGTITCNYDGMHKFETVIEDDVFVGSDSQLVAPVTIGRGSIVAAGTTVTKDVPTDGLAIARVPQANRPGWAARRRALPPLATGPKPGELADHKSGKPARASTAGSNAKSIPKGNAPRAGKPVVRARPMAGRQTRDPAKTASEKRTTNRRQSRTSH
jgi:bifunctional UDP-N-acetylglucosamine pyrophosphorylase/glucosamine-1-phosphate N-acetyltransferase